VESGALVPTWAEMVAQPAAPATVVTGNVFPAIGDPFLIDAVIEAGTVATEALLLERRQDGNRRRRAPAGRDEP
jgi:hypothetical protein